MSVWVLVKLIHKRFANKGQLNSKFLIQISKILFTEKCPKMTNAAKKFAAFVGPAFRLPARLAVGFGLEALPASGWIHPGRWQAVAHCLVPPLLGAED